MNEYFNKTLSTLQHCRADLANEKNTQRQLHQALAAQNLIFVREHRLDEKSIPDLFNSEHGIAIEVKIKGSKKEIYRQLLRYSEFHSVKILILCSNKALGLPPLIGGKPAYFIHLGKSWL